MTHSQKLSASARELLARRAGEGPHAGPVKGSAPEWAPLSTPQLGQWLFDEANSTGASVAPPKRLHLDGRLDRPALRQALTEIVRRHEMLRTVIMVRDGEPMQRVTPVRPVELAEVDLRGMGASEQSAALGERFDEDARRPFDLTSGVLIRPLLVQLDAESWELQICLPQVAFDGWSNGILWRELGALYSAGSAGIPPQLSELPVQYADFAAWERAAEARGTFDAEGSFWRKHLAGSTSTIDLLPDHPRRRDRAHRIGRVTCRIPEPLTTRLKALAAEEGVTLFTLTFAAFQVFVGRRSNQDDFVVGAVSANRAHRVTEVVIGRFMTALPIRARLGDAPSFRAHLRRATHTVAEAFAHQSYPFQRLFPELRPGNSAAIEPLFPVLFNFRNMPACLPAMDGIEVSDFRAPHLAGRFDIHLNVTPDAEELLLELEYDASRFEPETASRWSQGYQAFLAGVAEDPDGSTATLPVMPAAERRRVLDEWSVGPRLPARTDRPLGDLFLEQAARTPEATAIVAESGAWTFRALAERARQIADTLTASGVARGDCVALVTDRTPQMVAAMAGVALAGAACLAIDQDTPAERIAWFLEDSNARAVLTDAAGAAAVGPGANVRRLDLPEDWPSAPASARQPSVSSEDPLYFMYTSGSTGLPKGVVVPHRALVNWLDWAVAAYRFGEGDVFLQRTSVAFDPVWAEVWLPLLTGRPMIMARSDSSVDPGYLMELIRTHGITVIRTVPALLALLVETEAFAGCHTLRWASCGGEVVPPALAQRFHELCRADLMNGYGPTEVTISATAWRTEPAFTGSSLPIGRPINNSRIYVLDDRREPQPIGVPGELFLGGPGMSLGYHNRPEHTAERFVPSPFEPGQILFRTGDLVRFLPDGNLDFLGRIDEQVKVHGVRIEPGEIESWLSRHPDVVECAVRLTPAEDGGRLAAYIVARPDSTPTLEDLRRYLGRFLPHAMLPTVVLQLERLPRTAGGKVDRQALPLPERAAVGSEPPRTPMETTIAAVFSEHFGGIPVGREDNLYSLGGHSLIAMRIATRLRGTLGLDVTLRTILEYPRVSALAGELERLACEGSRLEEGPTISRAPRTPRPSPPSTT